MSPLAMNDMTHDEDAALTIPAGWKVVQGGRAIQRELRFKNFEEALRFVNKLGAEAEKANHHPDLTLGWGYVGITLTTHDSNKLTAKDIALAEIANQLLTEFA